jgi:hypothetical protein
MNEKRDLPHSDPDGLLERATTLMPIAIPGGVRTDFEDGSHLIESPTGERYLLSGSGAIDGTVPAIRRVQIDDCSKGAVPILL